MSGLRLTENGVGTRQASEGNGQPIGKTVFWHGAHQKNFEEVWLAAEMDRRSSQDSHVLMLHLAVGLDWT